MFCFNKHPTWHRLATIWQSFDISIGVTSTSSFNRRSCFWRFSPAVFPVVRQKRNRLHTKYNSNVAHLTIWLFCVWCLIGFWYCDLSLLLKTEYVHLCIHKYVKERGLCGKESSNPAYFPFVCSITTCFSIRFFGSPHFLSGLLPWISLLHFSHSSPRQMLL